MFCCLFGPSKVICFCERFDRHTYIHRQIHTKTPSHILSKKKGTPIEKDEEMGDKINITPEINYTENMKNQAFLAQINAFCDFSEMSLYFVEFVILLYLVIMLLNSYCSFIIIFSFIFYSYFRRPILFIAWVYAMSGGFFVVTGRKMIER